MKEIRVTQQVITINTINFAASSKIALDYFQEKEEDIYESLYFIPELNSRIISLINIRIEEDFENKYIHRYEERKNLLDRFMKEGSYLSFIKKEFPKKF